VQDKTGQFLTRKNQTDRRGQKPNFPPSSSIRLSLGTIFLLAAVGWLVLTAVKREMKNNLVDQLQTSLSSNVEALKIWMADKKLDAQVLASQPEIREKVLALVDLAKNKDVGAEFLNQTQELIWLREHLGSACTKYGFIGFVLMDSTGYQVGALLNEPLGTRRLIELSDFFYRTLQGETVISHPFPGEVKLPDENGIWHSDWPTMFASTPIHNGNGEIVAVLSFRIRPETAFTHMLEISRWGETGETYAFNRDGLMLSDSRFNADLKKAGLLPDRLQNRAILNIEIRNPGGNIIEGYRPTLPRKNQPLTLMALSATTGETGFNVEGYNDYRGVPVVGAWTWLPEYYFGLATEIEVEEAFVPLNTITQGFILIFGLLMVSTTAASFLRIRQRKIENERNLANEKVRVSETRFRAIMDNAGEAIITIDKLGLVETFNPAAEKMFGYRASEVIGKNIKLLMPEPYRSEHDGHMERYLETRSSKVLGLIREAEGLRKDGSKFDLELSATNMTIEDKIQFIGVVRDITERKSAEEKLRNYAVELKRSNEELQDFAAIASHDLQEPLRKIIAFGDRLQAMVPDLCQQGNDYLERMQKAAQRMQRLIDDLLLYSRVTTKAQPFNAVDLKNLVAQVVEDLEVPLKNTGRRIYVNDLPTLVGDVFQMRQLFQNILSNSLKYHRKGIPPVIHVNCSPGENGDWKITIEDNGIGFDMKYVEKIFKPFELLHTREEFEGTGMGLAICKKIVHRHGGEIKVKSEISMGSTFTLIFPRHSSSAPSPHIEPEPPRFTAIIHHTTRPAS